MSSVCSYNLQDVDKTVQLLGSEAPHGPILLAWAVVRQLYLEDDSGNLTRKMGNMALQLDIFPFLEELLSREPFSGKSVRIIVYLLIHYVIMPIKYTAISTSVKSAE